MRAVCIDLTGRRFGELVVLCVGPVWRPDGVIAKGRWWEVRCDCGWTGMVRGSSLRQGHTSRCQSCHNKRTGEMARSRGVRMPSGRLLVEVAESAGVSLNTAFVRYRRGWTEDEIALPVHSKRGRRRHAPEVSA